MLITNKLRYAVMFIVNLAQKLPNDNKVQPKRMSRVAHSESLSKGYLEHIISELKKGQLINSAKGPGGGYFLNDDPSLITLGSILETIGERIKITRCENNNTGCLANNDVCVTHTLWNNIGNYIKNYLYNTSIEDIVNDNLMFNNTNKYIYADYNSTAPIIPKVKTQLNAFIYTDLYNPSSIHKLGQKAKKIIEDVREKVLLSLNASNYEIVFTSSGTEANNLVMKGISNHKHIISAIEHPSILNSAENPIIIPVDKNGVVELTNLNKILQEHHKKEKLLISVMMANNETGVIQPIEEIVKMAHSFGAIVHTDAIQACGKIPIDINKLKVDLLTISSHKVGGIAGCGALIFNSSTIKITPIIKGGNQEKGLRAGTENVAAIYSFGIAISHLQDSINKMSELTNLRNNLENQILNLANKAIIFGNKVNRLSNTSCIYMPNVSNELQLMGFDLNNIAVSNGSACSSGKTDSSHVLTAMGVNELESRCSIRISLAPNTTKEDIQKIVNCWREIYQKSSVNRIEKVV